LVGAADESATGSASFFGPRRGLHPDSISLVQLRPPSIDKGTIAGAWGVGLGLFLFLGMVSVGVSAGVAFILAALSGAAIFLFVRTQGA
jgi:hypothetical protein